jgi:cis-3-alkyl-4-acyloxetan-2-one decarboxylase
VVSELYPFQSHFLELGGLRLHYLDEGKGEPVVMLHGNPSWSFYYRKLVLALRDRFRTVVPDHIGCGRSDKPGDDRYEYTLSRRVEDLERLLDHLELQRVTLIVHDWGGMIGFAWATRHPERVARLVVLNTAAFHLPRSKAFPAALALARLPGLSDLLVRGLNAFARGATRLCVTRRRMPPEVARAYREPYDSWQNRIAVHRFVQDIPLRPEDRAYALVSETAERLERLAGVPMLICWGMRDFVFDRHFLDEWVRRFPEAEVHRFEDAGHYVLEDAAEEIVPLVEKFLEAHPAQVLR